MNRNRCLGLFVFVLVAIAAIVHSWPTIDTAPNRLGIIYGYDTANSKYRPVQVDASGTQKVDVDFPYSRTKTIISIKPVMATLPALSGQRWVSITLHNQENLSYPVWINLEGGNAVVENGTPIYSNGRILSDQTLTYIASFTATATVIQESRQ